MESSNSLSQTEIIQKLKTINLGLFSITDFKKIFSISKDNTAYKIIARLTKSGILKKMIKGKYLFTLISTDDFQIANFMYPSSYISLESALSFYSILAQFPHQITSITAKKTRNIETLNKEFTYFHIKPSLFFDYEKKDNFLIASPEKALLDYLYFASKGLRDASLDEFDLSIINKKKLNKLAHEILNKNLNGILKAQNLC